MKQSRISERLNELLDARDEEIAVTKKLLRVETLMDPDRGCSRGGCPYLAYRVVDERIAGGVCSRTGQFVSIDPTEEAYYQPAPDWCELRELPDAPPGTGSGVHDGS